MLKSCCFVCLYLSNEVGDRQMHVKEDSPFLRITRL
jgi:hypothetical protein